jgi:NADH dehydrogenase (ubiquinone) 1 alpha subcomplex subunit 5
LGIIVVVVMVTVLALIHHTTTKTPSFSQLPVLATNVEQSLTNNTKSSIDSNKPALLDDMRPAARLYASVNKAGPRTLQPGVPTGLTGLLTHPAPRSTLIYLYSSTLSKLQQIPETSVYRQATEALTKKRLEIIKAVKPPGLDAWNDRMQFRLAEIEQHVGEGKLTFDGQRFVLTQMFKEEKDDRENEYNGMTPFEVLQGAVTQEMRDAEAKRFEIWEAQQEKNRPTIEPEPLLTVEQYVSPNIHLVCPMLSNTQQSGES